MPFSIIDGDDVGNKVESHLLSNNVSGFTGASKMITEFIESLADALSRVSTAKIVSAGGDSILVEIDQTAIGELIEVLDSRQRPGVFTFSAGVGPTLRESFIALRMAKSTGKQKTVLYPGE
ncbi:mCpol domain-containing protein [Streptomyces sp. 058-1L]|uniref:mCpol domain-containing protein n=1 Tax=Streptomyces sp. 058-1L TaxID=2789266 RepID=UPI0039815A48